MSDNPAGGERFSRAFYMEAVRSLLLRPGEFFGALPVDPGLKKPFLFLVTSSFILAALRTPFVPGGSIPMALLIFINGLAMPFASAAIGYGIILFAMKIRVGWARIFAIYAFASGFTYLISWLPLATWVGEPWKWILIGIGLVRGLGLGRGHAAGVVAGSVLALIVLFLLISSVFIQKG